MSGHNQQLGSQRHRAHHPTIWAAAVAVILLALTACASTAATTPNPTPTASVFGASSHTGTLTGAGSTFDAPFFDLAFAHYHQLNPGVSISYAAVGSGAGIAAFSAQKTDFGASDVPMTASEQAAATGGPSVQVPVALGAEVVVYNLTLPGGQRLHLTGPVIAKIFLGQITNWNDPAIAALNPGIDIPAGPITVVHRSDSSGTTYIFSDYLSSVDPAWAAKVGKGQDPQLAGRGRRRRQRERRRDGLQDPLLHRVCRTLIRARPGTAVRRNPQPGRQLRHTNHPGRHRRRRPKTPHHPTSFSIVNQPGADSYPITGYSWALVYTHQPNQATGQKLVTMLDWLIHTGQTYAATLGYVPLPPQTQQLAHTMLQQVTGPNGQHLLG